MDSRRTFAVAAVMAVWTWAGPARAAITINNIIGASSYDTTTSTTPIIYGGTAGPSVGCTIDGTNLCNSCLNTSTVDAQACNLNRIYDTLVLEIDFTPTSLTASGTAKVTIGTTTGSTDVPLIAASTAVANNHPAVVKMYWRDLCSLLLNGGGTCEAADISAATIRVGVNVDNDPVLSDAESGSVQVVVVGFTTRPNSVDDCDHATALNGGICEFRAAAGDEKVFITDLFPVNANPIAATTLSYSGTRVFYSPDGFAGALPSNPSVGYKDLGLQVNDDGTADLTSEMVKGLHNGAIYYFRMGMVDPAGNVAAITSNANISAHAACTGGFNSACIYMAQPDEVFGLLTKDVNCFIATAAYGSSFAPKVKTLREFRNRFLLKSEWGKQLILSYYKYGSVAAHWIVNSPVLRFVSRLLLWPVWLYAWMSLQWGLVLSTLIFAFVVLSGFSIYRWRQGKPRIHF
jgi:hypothetical protein